MIESWSVNSLPFLTLIGHWISDSLQRGHLLATNTKKTISDCEVIDNYKSFAALTLESHSKFGVWLDCTLEITLESSPR